MIVYIDVFDKMVYKLWNWGRMQTESNIETKNFEGICRMMKFCSMGHNDTPHAYDRALDAFPTTMYALKQLAGIENVWTYCKHVCGKRYCKVFDGVGEDGDEECGTEYYSDIGEKHVCDGRRYKRVGSRLVPTEYIFHFGIAHVLSRWQGNPEWWSLRAGNEARNPQDNDFWNGDLVQRMDKKMGRRVLREYGPIPVGDTTDVCYLRPGSAVEIGYDHYQAYRRK
jgi:hypothetical protein